MDKQLITMVAAYRRAKGVGPTWRELRSPFGDLLAIGPNSSDPLGDRLGRLRWAGAVRFDKTPRSLDITDTVRAALGRGAP
jgi:hypothetical protein